MPTSDKKVRRETPAHPEHGRFVSMRFSFRIMEWSFLQKNETTDELRWTQIRLVVVLDRTKEGLAIPIRIGTNLALPPPASVFICVHLWFPFSFSDLGPRSMSFARSARFCATAAHIGEREIRSAGG